MQSEYEKYVKSIEQKQKDYADKRQAQADSQKAAVQAAYRSAQEARDEEQTAQLAATERQYRELFDRNAVEQAVRQKQLQEVLANMGLTDSGLGRSAQTALTLRRAAADADARLGQQHAIDELLRQGSEQAAQAVSERDKALAQLQSEADKDIADSDRLWNEAVATQQQRLEKIRQNAEDRRLQIEEDRQLLYQKCLAAGWSEEDAWEYAKRKFPLVDGMRIEWED